MIMETAGIEPALCSRREAKVRAALDAEAHHTEHFSHAAGCSLGEAVVELLRLERAGLAVRGRGYAGMTWRQS